MGRYYFGAVVEITVFLVFWGGEKAIFPSPNLIFILMKILNRVPVPPKKVSKSPFSPDSTTNPFPPASYLSMALVLVLRCIQSGF